MSPAPHPRMHGVSHVRGGPDPIPCLPPCAPITGDYPAAVMALGPLGYWRLGEATAPWADTSGYDPGDPADLTLFLSGTAPTPDITGALAVGDDGAMEFNYDGVGGLGGQYLHTTGITDGRFDGAETVAAWIKIKSSGLTRRALILGTTNTVAGSPNYMGGWGLHVMYPAGSIRYSWGQLGGGATEYYATTPSGVAADTWVHVVGTYDGSTISLYINGALVDTEAATGGWAPNTGIYLGGSNLPLPNGDAPWLFGMVDEAAVWDRVLTASEIATLYTAGVSTGGAAGEDVLISDGAGGSTWGKVTSGAIEDDTITNTDISTSAEIQVSKLEEGASNGQVLKTVAGVPTWAASGASATDAYAWMPLTTVSAGVPDVVWDGDDQLIPTLTTI